MKKIIINLIKRIARSFAKPAWSTGSYIGYGSDTNKWYTIDISSRCDSESMHVRLKELCLSDQVLAMSTSQIAGQFGQFSQLIATPPDKVSLNLYDNEDVPDKKGFYVYHVQAIVYSDDTIRDLVIDYSSGVRLG